MTKTVLVAAAAAMALGACMTRGEPEAHQERRGMTPGAAQMRYAPFVTSTYSADAHTVDLDLATGVAVKRGWWTEELDMSLGAVDLSRAALGQVPVLFNHNPDDPIGMLSNVRLEAGALVGTCTFNQTDRGQEVEGMVARNELRGCSIGYQVNTWTLVEITGDAEIWRATSWALLEGTLTPVPADPAAGVRSAVSDPGAHTASQEELDDMLRRNQPGAPATRTAPETPAPAPAAAAPAAPGLAAPETRAAPAPAAAGLTVAEVLQAQGFARSLGVEAEIEPVLRRDGVTSAAVNQAILEASAARQGAAPPPVPYGSAARSGDADANVRGGIEDALFARLSRTAVTDRGRAYRGYRVAELIAFRAGLQDLRDPMEIMQRVAMTTSDFPNLLSAAANKFLLTAYQGAAPTYQSWCKRVNFNDFKPHSFLRVGEFPALVTVNENGEVARGKMAENKESASLGTKGLIVSLTRQVIINDDLGGFGDLVGAAGRSAARGENTAAYALLNSNPALADTVAVFHATHANLAGSGTAITVAAVSAGRAAMAKQKNIGNDELLNIPPRFLLTGPDKATEAEQFVAPVVATQTSNVNPFSGKLTPVSDANLTGNVWYLFADPLDAPCFVYGYLGDATAPMLAQESPLTVDGVDLRVLHDFGVGQIDYRGGYKNAGA
jgi:HK97 family phage prohead protease